MTFVPAVFACAVLACTQEQSPAPSPEQKEIARLQATADYVKDALAVGNLEAAKRLAEELSLGIARRESALKFSEKQALLPADGPDRMFPLAEAAKAAFEASDYDKAETYARELLTLAKQYPNHENYGDAIFKGNMVLGRIALARDKNVEDAKAALLASGQATSSPVLRSFGPNMSLAKDLLEAGERDTVLDFFDSCRKFWKLGGRKLDDWSAVVKGCCRMPHFGANLVY